MRPVPLRGAASSLICTLSSDEIPTLAIRWSVWHKHRHHGSSEAPMLTLLVANSGISEHFRVGLNGKHGESGSRATGRAGL